MTGSDVLHGEPETLPICACGQLPYVTAENRRLREALNTILGRLETSSTLRRATSECIQIAQEALS